MPTVIDSLVVLLNLDASKFTEDQKKALDSLKKTKDAAKSNANEMQAWSKQTAGAIGLVRNSALRLLAVFAAGYGLEQFTARTVTAVSAQGRLASRIGTTTREVALWQNAVRSIGGSADDASGTLSSLAQSLAELQITGQSPIVPWLNKLLGPQGWLDAQGHIKSTTQLLLDLSKAATSGQYTPAEATFFLQQIGIGPDTIALLERGTAAVQKYLDATSKAGLPDDGQAERLGKLQTAWVNFGNALDTVGRNLLDTVAPTLAKGIDALTDDVENGFKGGLVGRAQSRQNEENEKHGYIVDPVSGIVVPLGPPSGGAAASGGGLSLFDLIQQLEGSGGSSVSSKGAVGRNQITPDTARTYGFDPSRLSDPAYNDIVARAIEADLSKRYHGDVDAIAVAYNAGPTAADRYLAGGRNDLSLPGETQKYLAHERALTGGGAGNTTSVTLNGNIIVNTRATDGAGTAQAIGSAIRSNSLVTPANQGPQ